SSEPRPAGIVEPLVDDELAATLHEAPAPQTAELQATSDHELMPDDVVSKSTSATVWDPAPVNVGEALNKDGANDSAIDGGTNDSAIDGGTNDSAIDGGTNDSAIDGGANDDGEDDSVAGDSGAIASRVTTESDANEGDAEN